VLAAPAWRGRVGEVSLIDPDSPAQLAAMAESGLPGRLILRQDKAALADRTTPAVALGAVHGFAAPSGFLLASKETPAAVEAWSLLIAAWGRAAQRMPADAPAVAAPPTVPESAAPRKMAPPRGW
jgi:hypothetical protein